MSDTDSLALEGLRVLKREAELDAVAVKARNEALAEAIDMLEHPRPRRGRPPRNASAANQNPMQGLQAHLNPHPSQSQDALQKAAPYPGQGHANPYPGQILEMPPRVDEATPEPETAA